MPAELPAARRWWPVLTAVGAAAVIMVALLPELDRHHPLQVALHADPVDRPDPPERADPELDQPAILHLADRDAFP